MGLTTQTFDILTRIAIGNGSLVYKGVDKETLRKVALKLLTKDDELDHGYDVEALFGAVPQLRLITGSHVCQLLDAINDDDGPVLVYEFAGGISGLEFPLQRKLDSVQAIDVSAQIISALRSGERQRTPHGDLKPSNVMFMDTPEKRPFTFVLDWGLAAFRPELTKDSRPYLAPERLAGGRISHQADLFSAGALIFYLLTGKVLAIGETDAELQAAWARVRPEVLADLRPDLPAKFVQWVCWLLQIDPQKRPGSAVDAASALGMLNPPSAMIPPEEIRPRPLSASQRAQAAGLVSGANAPSPSRIASPPTSSVARSVGSGVRSAPATAGSSASGVSSASSSAPAPNLTDGRAIARTNRKVTMIAALSVGLVAAVAGTSVWWMRREKTSPIPIVAQVSKPTAGDALPAKFPAAETAPVSLAAQTPPPEQPKKKAPPSTKEGAKTAAAKPPPQKPAPAKAPVAAAPPAPAVAMTVGSPMPPETKPAGKVMPVALGSKPAASPPKAPAPVATPAPVASESFAYAGATAIQGQKAGRGWVGGWESAGAKVRDGSLMYPGFSPIGGSLVLPAGNETVSARRVMGPTAKLIEDPKKVGHWYFATLIRHSDQTAGAGGEVRIYPVDPDAAGKGPYIELVDVGNALRISVNGSSMPQILPDASKPVLLVCRMDVVNPKDGKWDFSMSLLVNPPSDPPTFKDAGKPIKADIKAMALPGQTGVMIRKSNGTAETTVDEVRFSEHWADLQLGGPKTALPVGKVGVAVPGA